MQSIFNAPKAKPKPPKQKVKAKSKPSTQAPQPQQAPTQQKPKGKKTKAENEYLAVYKEWRKHLPTDFGRLYDPKLSDERREQLFDLLDYSVVERFGWAIPDSRALNVVARFAPVVEVACGLGYWGALLRKRGVDWIGYDLYTYTKDTGDYERFLAEEQAREEAEEKKRQARKVNKQKQRAKGQNAEKEEEGEEDESDEDECTCAHSRSHAATNPANKGKQAQLSASSLSSSSSSSTSSSSSSTASVSATHGRKRKPQPASSSSASVSSSSSSSLSSSSSASPSRDPQTKKAKLPGSEEDMEGEEHDGSGEDEEHEGKEAKTEEKEEDEGEGEEEEGDEEEDDDDTVDRKKYPAWTEVLRGGPEALEKHDDRTLMLAYSDEFEESDFSVALEALHSYSGSTVIVIGEGFPSCALADMAPWGKSHASDFQVALAEGFHLILSVPLPSWPASHDMLSVWKRTLTTQVDDMTFKNIPVEERISLVRTCPATKQLANYNEDAKLYEPYC